MGLHPAMFVGVLVVLGGAVMFSVTNETKMTEMEGPLLVTLAGIGIMIYGAFAGKKDQLTGSGKKYKDHYC